MSIQMVKKKNSPCDISSICHSEKSHIPEFCVSHIRYFVSLFPRKTRFVYIEGGVYNRNLPEAVSI